jgi:hypothetical protein
MLAQRFTQGGKEFDMRARHYFWMILFAFLAAGCAAISIEPVDYSWGIESVLTVAADGTVEAPPRTPRFNAAPLFVSELGQVPPGGKALLRVIRNRPGFYFVTAPAFKHVYIFRPAAARLKLVRKILVNPDGMKKPAFNQRDPHIQLVDGERVWMLTENGISGGNR